MRHSELPSQDNNSDSYDRENRPNQNADLEWGQCQVHRSKSRRGRRNSHRKTLLCCVYSPKAPNPAVSLIYRKRGNATGWAKRTDLSRSSAP